VDGKHFFVQMLLRLLQSATTHTPFEDEKLTAYMHKAAGCKNLIRCNIRANATSRLQSLQHC